MTKDHRTFSKRELISMDQRRRPFTAILEAGHLAAASHFNIVATAYLRKSPGGPTQQQSGYIGQTLYHQSYVEYTPWRAAVMAFAGPLAEWMAEENLPRDWKPEDCFRGWPLADWSSCGKSLFYEHLDLNWHEFSSTDRTHIEMYPHRTRALNRAWDIVLAERNLIISLAEKLLRDGSADNWD